MQQKTWMITGANRGIGAAIAQAVLAAGHRAVLGARNLASLQSRYAGYAEQVLLLPLDVCQPVQITAAVQAATQHFGCIDVLVNNAGYGQLGMFEEVSGTAIRQQFDTNVFGLMEMTRAVLPLMRQQKAGHIFNLSSIAGLIGFPLASAYCASKFAIEGFSESLAKEVAEFGIQITLVEPGFFRTDFLDQSSVHYGSQAIADYAVASAASRQTYDSYNHQQAGDPDKLAAALLKLALAADAPLRYLAGSDAVAMLDNARHSQQQELQQWRQLSMSTDGVF